MSLAELSIKRPIFIISIVSLMLIMGYSSLKKMSVDMFPDVSFPVIFIQTVYPGASPLDMEKLVSKPIEDELGNLSGLERITSTNAESVSYVILEFKLGSDIKDLEQQVRQRLGNIRRNLPVEIKDPVIRRFDPADQSIVRLAVTSQLPPAELYDLVDDVVKPQFETIHGVGQVTLVGGVKREIQVLVNKNKVQERNISLLQISEKIKNTSKDVPVGKVESGTSETVLRASGEFESIKALSEVNVNFLGSDQVVRLQTIANVKEGTEDRTSIATLMRKDGNFERKPTMFLEIFKQSGSNTVKVVDTVRAKIDKVNELLKERKLDIVVSHVRDGAQPIRLNIQDVRESIAIGIILCIVVVFFFLGSGRSTFITGMALPNSLLGGFVIMYLMGFSVNIMTLMALSLAVGLLIDDAIVVRENIFRHMEMGENPRDAAIKGTKEVALAVIATTLVVIAVFGPIAFLDGIIGQFFKQFGLTIVFTMLISLFDAFTVAPMLSAYMAVRNEHHRGTGFVDRMLGAFDRFQTWLENRYEDTVRWVLRHQLKTLIFAFLFFIGSLVLVKFIPKNFMAAPDNAEFIVKVERPVGTNLEATAELTRKVENLLKANPAIELLATVVGSGSGQSESNKASIYVHLVPRKERSGSTSTIKDQIRPLLSQFSQEGIVSLADIDMVGGNQKPFIMNVTSEDLDQLSAYVDKLVVRLKKIKGLVDLDTNYRAGKPEYHVDFDREKSESLGVSTVTAGAELRARVEGVVPATYRKNGKEYDIRVRLREEDRDLRQNFVQTQVPNSNYNMIPLSKVAKGSETLGYSQINRQNKARYIKIDASLDAKGNLGDITNEIDRLLKEDPEFKLPPGITYKFQGQAEDFRDLLDNMLMAMFLGIVFIFLVLASLYESFITPFTILLAIPLGISGALAGLFVTQKSIDIFSLIGIVMLLGVVAKNSILLVDYTKQLTEEGMPRRDALLKASKTRLRPILMTSFALIAGTVPIAIGLNEASAMRTSMGIAIIGGLITSTLLTLIVVPAAYGYVDDFRMWIGKKIRKIRGQAEEPKIQDVAQGELQMGK
ncbi:MAG: multidrug transporter AcrB [Oligoflexia bacterium]|nr:MAG: multidrug transporter AcrB [Oligoflexia bacterium]